MKSGNNRRALAAPGDGDDDGHEQNQTHLKENGEADQHSHEHHGKGQAAWPEAADQTLADGCGSSGAGQQMTEQRA